MSDSRIGKYEWKQERKRADQITNLVGKMENDHIVYVYTCKSATAATREHIFFSTCTRSFSNILQKAIRKKNLAYRVFIAWTTCCSLLSRYFSFFFHFSLYSFCSTPPLPLYSVSCPNCLYPHSLLDVAMQVPAHSHTYKRTHALIKEVFCSARLRYSVWLDRSSVVLYLV